MHLFELAIELGERSADMAEAAESLGFEGITPTSELTPEQVQAFRARYAKAAPPPPAGSAYQPPSSWGPPPGTGAPAPAPSGSGRSLGVGQILLIVAALAGVAALFGYMMSNSGPDARQEQQLAASAEEHEAEIAADNAAAATSSPDDPRDLARFCSAVQSLYDFSQAQVLQLDQDDLEGTRKIVVAGFEGWKQDLAVVKETGPPSFDDDLVAYEQNRRPYYEIWLSSEDLDVIARNMQGFDPGPGAQPWHDLQTMLFERC